MTESYTIPAYLPQCSQFHMMLKHIHTYIYAFNSFVLCVFAPSCAFKLNVHIYVYITLEKWQCLLLTQPGIERWCLFIVSHIYGAFTSFAVILYVCHSHPFTYVYYTVIHNIVVAHMQARSTNIITHFRTGCQTREKRTYSYEKRNCKIQGSIIVSCCRRPQKILHIAGIEAHKKIQEESVWAISCHCDELCFWRERLNIGL